MLRSYKTGLVLPTNFYRTRIKEPVIITRIKSSSNLLIFLVFFFFCLLFRVDFKHLVLSLLAVVPTNLYSVAWGLDGLMERRERITTSQGLGIKTPERGLGPLFSLVVVLLCCCCVIMFLLGKSSRSQPPDLCHAVRFH